jgi:hypothetical protein
VLGIATLCLGVSLVGVVAPAAAAAQPSPSASAIKISSFSASGILSPGSLVIVSGQASGVASGALITSFALGSSTSPTSPALTAYPITITGTHPSSEFRDWIPLPSTATLRSHSVWACTSTQVSTTTCGLAGSIATVAEPPEGGVTPTLNPAKALTAFVGSAGGSWSVKTADGTSYTLVVPSSAQPTNLVVTITPVTSISPSSVVGALNSGIMVTPIGNALPDATVRIVLPTAIAPGEQVVAFGASADSPAYDTIAGIGTSITVPLAGLGGIGLATRVTAAPAFSPLVCDQAASPSLPTCFIISQEANHVGAALDNEINQARHLALTGDQAGADALINQAAEDFKECTLPIATALAAILQPILAIPPTDAAEPLVMATELLLLSVIRQAQLLGVEALTPLTGLLVDIIHWLGGLVEMHCTDTTPTSSDLLAPYGIDAQGLSKTAGQIGSEQDASALLQAEKACFSRLKYAVTFDDTETETIPNFKVSIDVTALPALKNQNSGASTFVTGSGDFDYHSVSVKSISPGISNVVITHTGGALKLVGEVNPTTSLGCVNHVLTITRSAQLVINPQTGINSSDQVDWTYTFQKCTAPDIAFPVNEWQAFTVASWPPNGPPKWVITLASDGTKWTKSFNFVAGAGTGVVDFSATPSQG